MKAALYIRVSGTLKPCGAIVCETLFCPRIVMRRSGQHALVNEGVEPLRQDVAAGTDGALELLEPAGSEARLAHDEQRQAVANASANRPENARRRRGSW